MRERSYILLIWVYFIFFNKVMELSRLRKVLVLFTVLCCSTRQVITETVAPEPEAALAQATKGNPGDKSNDFQTNQGFRNSGCYKDTEARAVPPLEGSDPDLTGFYKQRQDPISKCAAVARSRGYQLFAIQNGGMCLSGPKAQENYKIHGLARNCKDGKGGEWANDVYIFNDFPLQLHIFTGTEPEAGTDANVYITLSGSMGTSRRISLASENANQNPFEAGQKDVFKLHTIPLGAISGITIGHDDTGQKPADWFLQKIVVKDAANTMYKFDVNRWLAKGKDDGQIERELSLTATISPGSYKQLGCFKERTDVNKDRAIPSLEGRDDVLDGLGTTSYRGREFPIEKCADVARRRGYVMFAIQDGGLCAASKEIQNTYDTYGKGDDCMINGTGSAFSSTVYTFSDEEPGFQDAESSNSGTEEGSKNTQAQPAPPSDPAMQMTGQSPSSTASIPAKHNMSPNEQSGPSTAAVGTPSEQPGDLPENKLDQAKEKQDSTTADNPERVRNPAEKTEETQGQKTTGNSPDQSSKSKPKQNYPLRTDTTPQEPKLHPGRANNEIPKSENQPNNESETPLGEQSPGEGSPVEKGSSAAVGSPGGEGSPVEKGSSAMVGSPGGEGSPVEKGSSAVVGSPGGEGSSVGKGSLGLKPVGEVSPVKEGSLEGGQPPTGEGLPIGKGSRAVEGSPVIEAPLQTNVNKIAPETRLPGEFASPSREHNILLKSKQIPIKRLFSKLIDARQRDHIGHAAKRKNRH